MYFRTEALFTITFHFDAASSILADIFLPVRAKVNVAFLVCNLKFREQQNSIGEKGAKSHILPFLFHISKSLTRRNKID